MRRYETIYIVDPNIDAESLDDVATKFLGLITKLKGTIIKISDWGKRKLAYEVKRFDKGYYFVLDFCGLPESVKELERNLKLDDRVLKYLTVKIDDDVDPESLKEEEVVEEEEEAKEGEVAGEEVGEVENQEENKIEANEVEE